MTRKRSNTTPTGSHTENIVRKARHHPVGVNGEEKLGTISRNAAWRAACFRKKKGWNNQNLPREGRSTERGPTEKRRERTEQDSVSKTIDTNPSGKRRKEETKPEDAVDMQKVAHDERWTAQLTRLMSIISSLQTEIEK